jgi:hypothetical protein
MVGGIGGTSFLGFPPDRNRISHSSSTHAKALTLRENHKEYNGSLALAFAFVVHFSLRGAGAVLRPRNTNLTQKFIF